MICGSGHVASVLWVCESIQWVLRTKLIRLVREVSAGSVTQRRSQDALPGALSSWRSPGCGITYVASEARAGPSARPKGHDEHDDDDGEYNDPQDRSRWDSHRPLSIIVSPLNDRSYSESEHVVFAPDGNTGVSGWRELEGNV